MTLRPQEAPPRRRAELTFRGNQHAGRHGWLRLTPAYGVRLAVDLLANATPDARVLDPFAGSATTLLAAAERGHEAVGVELNPFLVRFGNLKLGRFQRRTLAEAERRARDALARHATAAPASAPPMFRIERWWAPPVLAWLCQLRGALDLGGRPGALLEVAFLRTMMALSGASFGHVSMSFRDAPPELPGAAGARFLADVAAVLEGARSPVAGRGRVLRGDARTLTSLDGRFDRVLTSPPYPNRISYVRELRPYMYWSGHLKEAREAGELDWEAIGGTWGIATSRLKAWTPKDAVPNDLAPTLEAIAAAAPTDKRANGPLLANYVARYFEDMAAHFRALRPHVAAGGRLDYVIGNASFYGVLVPAEQLLAARMETAGFEGPEARVLRKRNSKRELYEYVVTARG
ncbi:MAG: DNA methyltransferase [Myxococcota bacterium]